MACSVLTERPWLTRSIWLIACVVSLSVQVVVAETAATGQAACPKILAGAEKVQQHYVEFRQSVEKGPWYRTMVQRWGAVQTCSAKAEDSAISLVYEFERGARLAARRDPSIEFAEQRITVNDLDQGEAVTLLRNAERDFFSTEGCGISWRKLPRKEPAKEAGSASDVYDLIYRGNVCNCQGRLTYQKGALVALVFRSTC